MEYWISADKQKLNIEFIHGYLANSSYWGKGRTLQQTKKTVASSYCFGLYTAANEQIGFARVVTDFVFFGNIMDVFVAPAYQGKGLGKALVGFMLNDSVIRGLQTLSLKTKDAHAFYEKYGFNRIGNSPIHMSRDRQKLDQ